MFPLPVHKPTTEHEQEEMYMLYVRKSEQKVNSRKIFKGNVSLSAIHICLF